jgi:hypothetical protein
LTYADMKDKAAGRANRTDIILIILLAVLGFALIYTIYSAAGPQWDLIARSLLGKTVINYLTHNISPQAAFVGEFQNNLLYYYEPYREPVSILAFALLSAFFQNTILPYLIFAFFAYVIAIYMFSKRIGMDKLVAFATFLNGYSLYFLFLPNGGEVFAVIFVLLGTALLIKKSPVSGLFFGLATLSKYPAIALLPLVLLLGDRKKILKAVALEAIVLLLFVGFDYFIYGNPIYSFTESIANSNALSPNPSVDPGALLTIFSYPAAIAALGVAALLIKRRKLKINFNFTTKAMLLMIFLAAVEAIIIIPHNDPATQARYGFLLMTSLLIPASLILNSAARKMENLRYLAVVLALAMLLILVYSSYVTGSSASLMYNNPNNSNGIYSHAATELAALGFGGCRFISNSWIEMLYIGHDAYSPFSAYPSPTITPDVERVAAAEGINYTRYAQGVLEYPIIVFKYSGVDKSFIANLNQSKLVYNDANISIYLPQGAICYRD